MKRKSTFFRTLLVAVTLLAGATSAWAYTPTLSNTLSVAGYKNKAYYNIANTNVDGMCPTTGDLRYRGEGYGLFNFGSGGRGANVTLPFSKDDIVILDFKDSQNRSITVNSVDNCTKDETLSKSTGFLVYKATADAGTTTNINVGRGGCIIAILVMEKDNSVQTADYTINYVYDENIIATDQGTDVIGAVINVPTVKKVDEWNYILVDGQPTSLTIAAGTNVLDVQMREAEIYNYTVVAKDGSGNQLGEELDGGEYQEGDPAISVTYPRYILSGTTLYCCGSGAISYSTSFTPDADNYEKVITYNSGTVNDVMFYYEGEDVGTATGTNARASMGKMGYTSNASTYAAVDDLEPGKYVIYMRGQNGNSASRTFNFKIDATVVFTGKIDNGTNMDFHSEEFSIGERSSLSFACEGSSASGIDYIYVVKTGEFTVPATITEAGWATLYTDYDLDFSRVEGLTAYTATCDGQKVTLTEVSDVPVSTGVVLKGAPDTYNIPLKEEGSTTDRGDLEGSTTESMAFDDYSGYDLYILVQNGQGQVQFTKMTSGEVAAGKAYLPVMQTDDSGEARLNVVFENETTGISTVAAAEQAADAVYSLSGQRVATPKKGLYIVNGKKMIIK